MRLLAYWIIFMVLLVVFVPAFSMIFSPPAYTPCPASECPPCPECPPPRVFRIYPWWASKHVEEDFTRATLVYGVNLRKLVGYKYFVLVNLYRYDIVWSEYCFGRDEEGLPLRDYLDFKRLNSTHSYAFIDNNVRGILIEVFAWDKIIDVDNVHVIILIVDRDATLQDVLRYLQRAIIL